MNLDTEFWSSLPELKHAVHDHCSVVYNNKLYAIGGS